MWYVSGISGTKQADTSTYRTSLDAYNAFVDLRKLYIIFISKATSKMAAIYMK